MMKAATDKQLVIGLTPRELQFLKEGKPLIIQLADVGFPGSVVTIFVGESNEEMQRMIEQVNETRRLMEMVPKLDLSKVNLSGMGKKGKPN